jgi:1-aminocyclopropane-1-carboxylate deaminase/D-cysteine desulfhydrase-like pyridoxal-dependent ACC family enzyme
MPALSLPSPVYPFDVGSGVRLWVKDDGALHPVYGGNKTRKLAAVLIDVAASGSRRIVTFGCAGSHHVLATALFATQVGIPVHAILLPEPHTEHVEVTFRALVGQGLTLSAALSPAAAAFALLQGHRRGDYVLLPGGAGLAGTLAYAEAARELEQQVASGALPEPDEIVVALGSGATAAGLLAGLATTRLSSRVVAVEVTGNAFSRAWTLRLAARAARALGVRRPELGARLSLVRGELGAGYGFPTSSGAAAGVRARSAGLGLDPTYTQKAFAHALARAARAPGAATLYWHTLSSAPLEPLLVSAPALDQLEPRLRRLLLPLAP